MAQHPVTQAGKLSALPDLSEQQRRMDLTHHFLLSMPGLADSWFEKTVTYIFEHNEDGALGFVINRRAAITAGDVFEQLDIECKQPSDRDAVTYEGGPIDMERGFVLYPAPQGSIGKHCADGGHGINLSGSAEILTLIGTGNGPSRYLLLLGYAGWEAGQLESEIADNAWLTCQAETDLLFSTDPDEKFNLAAQSMGIVDFSLLSADKGHA